MIADTDYVGLATLISSIGAVLTGLIVALRQTGVKANVADIHEAVQTPGDATLGETMAHVHDAVCDGKDADMKAQP